MMESRQRRLEEEEEEELSVEQEDRPLLQSAAQVIDSPPSPIPSSAGDTEEDDDITDDSNNLQLHSDEDDNVVVTAAPPPLVSNAATTRKMPAICRRRRSSKDSDEQTKPEAVTTTAATPSTMTAAADIAREQHDFFNIFALLVVVATTLVNWDLTKILSGPEAAWKGTHFYLNWASTVLYFLADLVWVAWVPICVKSPGTIIKHHLVAIAYLSAPVVYPEFRWFMGACLSVEINTWFLILRRVVYKRREQVPQIVSDVVSVLFYASWIVIRLFIYPAILFIFLRMAQERVTRTQQLWHWPMVFIPIHFFLCVLNIKWSYDLFLPIWKKFKEGNTASNTVSSGL